MTIVRPPAATHLRALASMLSAALPLLAVPAGAQVRPDSATAPDSARRRADVVLAPVQVRASIVPSAAPSVGSGVPARVEILSGRAIEAWEPRLLPDALAAQPGVSTYDDLGTPWKLTLSTRGFTTGPTVGLPPGVSVFLDGVRQNEPAAQEVNFDLLPLAQVERVELLSGSASLLGPNSLGGAINLVTARGSGPASGEVELSGGSFGQIGGEGTVRGRTARGLDYFASGGTQRERGWRDATGARTHNGFVNLGRTGERRGVTLQAFASRSRAETAGSLPESLLDASPRANFTAGDFEDLNAQQLALSGYAPVGVGRGGLTVYARRSSAERFNVNQAPDPDVRSLTSNFTVGGTADWRHALTLGPGALALRLGLDGSANRVRARIYAEARAAEPEPPAVVEDDDEAGDDAPTGLTTDVRSPSVDVAGYALLDYRIGRATVSGGGRYDFVRVPFRNQIRTYDNTTNDYRSFSPRLGASVALGPGASLYASFGRSFRAPAILELGCADEEAVCPLPFALGDDPPLAPVRATTYEAGGQLARGSVVATASAYRTEVRDEIFFVASDAALLSGYFTNLDRTRREGVELGLQGTAAAARLSWYANYAWTRATFRSAAALFSIRGDDDFEESPLAGGNDVSPGSRLPLVPDQQVKAGGVLRLAAGLSLGLDARYTGRQWLRGDEANVTAPLDAYAIASARIGYARAGWDVSAIVTNLFDARDATFGTFNENRRTGALERFLTPLNARAVRLVLRRQLGAGASNGD
jgi:outer membrane receptor protein involved in Fe transport